MGRAKCREARLRVTRVNSWSVIGYDCKFGAIVHGCRIVALQSCKAETLNTGLALGYCMKTADLSLVGDSLLSVCMCPSTELHGGTVEAASQDWGAHVSTGRRNQGSFTSDRSRVLPRIAPSRIEERRAGTIIVSTSCTCKAGSSVRPGDDGDPTLSAPTATGPLQTPA